MFYKVDFFLKLYIIIVCNVVFHSLNAQQIYEYSNRLAFAEHMFISGDYVSASLEYTYIIDSFPQDKHSAHMYIRSLCAQQKYGHACSFLESYPMHDTNAELFAVYIQLLLKTNQYSKADSLLEHSHILNSLENNTLELYSKLLNNKKQDALQQIALCKEQKIPLPDFLYTIPNYKVWKYTLSSIFVPGLGKILTDAPYDGLYSMYSVGVTGFVSYRAFCAKGLSSFNGWAFGLVTAGMYAGNIYGTIKHVHTVPHSIIQEIHLAIENNLVYNN